MAGEIGDFCGIDFIGGGLGAVDKIDGAVLQDKDHFLVVTPSVFAPLSLDADSGAGENSPQVIAPDTNAGNKRWILKGGVFANLTVYGAITATGLSLGTGELTCGSINRASGILTIEIGGVPTLSVDVSGMDLMTAGIFGIGDGGLIRCLGGPGGPEIRFDYTNAAIEFANCNVGIGQTPAAGVRCHMLGTVLYGLVYKNTSDASWAQFALRNDLDEEFYFGLAGSAAAGWANKAYLSAPADHALQLMIGGGTALRILSDLGISVPGMKTGTDQANAGAAANELYADTNDDNTVKLGV